jgi:fatty acid synthase
MSEKRHRSSKWLITSAHDSDTSPKLYLAKYYRNYLLSPVLFADAIRLVPAEAVTIEILPQNILHCVLKDSLYSTITNIPLHSHSDNVEIFLQAIGELYNAGLQPQISKLYSTAEFPVSRGTPMISPLIRYATYILQAST